MAPGKIVYALFLSLLLSLAFTCASAAPCTSETCPEGPVMAFFEYENCTGAVVYESFLADGVCRDGSKVIVESNALVLGEFDDSDCDETLGTYIVDAYHFGRCGPSSVGYNPGIESFAGRIALASVNDTFDAPQHVFDNLPVPAYNDDTPTCYSVDNCTLSDGSAPAWYQTYYSEYNCSSPSYSIMSSYAVLGGCYNDENNTYTKQNCAGDHSFSTSYHTMNGCSNAPYLTSIYHATCGPNSKYLVQCKASSSPTSPSSSTPSSSSSIFQPSFLFAFIFIMASFIL